MAAPPEKTLKNMTGEWVVASKLSKGFDESLALQGLPWWKRQFVFIVTLHESMKQHIDKGGITHIDIDLSITGGFKGGQENRIIDGKKHAIETEMLGTIYEQARWANLDDIDDPWLKESWVYTADELKNGGGEPNGELHIEIRATNCKGGFDTQAVWGFTEIDGVRYHCRRGVCRKGDEVARAIGIYGYIGPKK
ncbi:hypothetical protein VTI74DRAFT_9189 [Chaetomium olivicolor]